MARRIAYAQLFDNQFAGGMTRAIFLFAANHPKPPHPMASTNLVPTPEIAIRLNNFRAISAASNNATVVKAGPGSVVAIVASNINAAVRYLKLYDKATTPAPASDNALLVMVIPLPSGVGASPIQLNFPQGVQFRSGISFALVTGITDTDNTAVAASEQLVNLQYV